MSVLDFEVLDSPLKELNRFTMLLLPLLSDLLLVDHHGVGFLLESFVPLLHLNHDRLQVSHFLIGFILDLV